MITQPAVKARQVIDLTRDWGDWSSVSLYLNRCQVDTPSELVEATWAHVSLLRPQVGKVLDLGAGDARFAFGGTYAEYVGYEIDGDRCADVKLPPNARLLNRCAFSDDVDNADVCIGNPPFVRNQDLPAGWREQASKVLQRRLGIHVSGLANAWQYFFLQALASLKDDGLCALVIPYEWVSRPSARALRTFIEEQRWEVNVYRLVDTTFDSVLTTSSITIVDKAKRTGTWSYFEETAEGKYLSLPSPSGSSAGVISYAKRSDIPEGMPRAIRGLSPGTQKVLTLTEGERVRSGLMIGRDVVPCITTLRTLPGDLRELDDSAFKKYYRSRGQKCWLIRTDIGQSAALRSYLNAVPAEQYQTATCLERLNWWEFKMPPLPDVLIAQSFKGEFPKGVRNAVGARAVGGVTGIYNATEKQMVAIVGGLDGQDLRDRVVAHSNGLRKIEINQLNALLLDKFSLAGSRD
ncbi:class I SAM-dependent methyltransferase [Mesorhizobium sp. B2-4-18]|uniref:Eco57I restriction-modification methylase domain-containing protein n=1 Tax=Mesorhizobium sp. B2-4-18 TaxID=2589931 RepID=UPI00112DADF1|nr:Eco57I restriction-modification methylase domain-containing protein [Mesorhizobium sp. B2-4-18]TPK71909.1 class I SAM-dependent methyltransferase [Mesorhizobium sp. B2-4-18]